MAQQIYKQPLFTEDDRKAAFEALPVPDELKLYHLRPNEVPLTKENLKDEAGSQVRQIVEGAITNNTYVQNLISSLSTKTAIFVVGPASNSDSSSYDYVTDGTDDDVQIQAAIDALPTSGGRIILREGTYTIGAPIDVDKSGVTIQGQGKGTTVKAKTSLDNDIFRLYSDTAQHTDTVITMMTIDGNSSNQTSGTGIDNVNGGFANNNRVEISHCYFKDIKGAAIITNAHSNDSSALINDCYFTGVEGSGSNYALLLNECTFVNNHLISSADVAIVGSNSGNYIIANNYFDLPASYSKTAFLGANTAIFTNNRIVVGSSATSTCKILSAMSQVTNNSIGFGTSADVASVAMVNCSLVSDNTISRPGIGVSVSGIGDQDKHISNNRISNCVGNSISVASTSSTNTILAVNITGNTIFGSKKHGISITGPAQAILISSNQIVDTSLDADNTYSGIYLDASPNAITRCVISNNVIDASGTNNFKYGVEETTNCNSNVIVGNVVSSAQTDGFFIVGTSTEVSHNITI